MIIILSYYIHLRSLPYCLCHLHHPHHHHIIIYVSLFHVYRYAAHFNDFLDGRSTFPIADVSTQQLFGGARINYVFHDVFGGHIDSIDPFDNLTDQDIRTAIRNATGPKPSLFLPEASFEMLVKKQVGL